MIKLNKITFIVFGLFFLFITHIWSQAFGVVGLGLQQNNYSWLFVSVVVALALCHIHYTKSIVLPPFWVKGSIALLVILVPFIFGDKNFIREGILLPLGLITIWIFSLAVIQIDIIRKEPWWLIVFLMASIFIQVLWGFLETFHAVMVNHTNNALLLDPGATGVFNQKNVFGSFLATGLSLSLFSLTKYNFQRVKLQKITNFLHLFFVLIAVFTLVFSNSRVSYIGSIIGVLLVLPYALHQDKKKTIIWLLFGIASLIISLILLSSIGRVEKELASGGERIGMYLTCLYAIMDAPIFGHGLGSFESVYTEKFAVLFQLGSLPEASQHKNLIHPHNEILLWGVEGGLVSILGLLGMVFILFRHLLSKSFKTVAAIGLLFPIILHSMVEMPFYQSALHLITLTLLYIFSYLFVHSETNDTIISLKKTSLLPATGILFLVAATLAFSLNIKSLNTFTNFLNQKNRNIEALRGVSVYFGWENTYNYIYNASLSQIGIRNDKAELSKPYIKWAEQAIKTTPKLDYYRTLIYAYENTGQIKRAFETASKLDYNYRTHKPTQRWLDNFYKHMESKGYLRESYSSN
ncbi:PglL family O-oligosaccharyltransferase [Kangiella shandongensis]|uniref:PglL family O-oligosaccharyltransferase n=1 Tax=Kangiella shandongensis TaxID=2763258 RepID=UPI001CBE3198|nr:Wzy polymerase domain-containing protein [Kangiella shandongensis]